MGLFIIIYMFINRVHQLKGSNPSHLWSDLLESGGYLQGGGGGGGGIYWSPTLVLRVKDFSETVHMKTHLSGDGPFAAVGDLVYEQTIHTFKSVLKFFKHEGIDDNWCYEFFARNRCYSVYTSSERKRKTFFCEQTKKTSILCN